MFLPATASIMRLLTPFGALAHCNPSPSPPPYPKHCILLTLTIMPIQVFTLTHTDLIESHTRMHVPYIHQGCEDKHVKSPPQVYTHTHTLTGVDAFAVTDPFKSSSRADPCKPAQLKDVTLEVFTAHRLFFFFFNPHTAYSTDIHT